MKILVGFPDAEAWVQAARWLGHEAATLDSRNAILQFDEFQPDVALVPHAAVGGRGRTPTGEALNRHPEAKWALLYQPGMEASPPRGCDLFVSTSEAACLPGGYHLKPATQFLPDFPFRRWRSEFICHVLVTEPYKREREAAVNDWVTRLRVKIVGPSPWPYPQYLGSLSPPDLWDAISSVTQVADFGLTPSERLDVVACGGNPVGAHTVTAEPMQFYYERAEVLAQHTLVNRLTDILERLTP